MQFIQFSNKFFNNKVASVIYSSIYIVCMSLLHLEAGFSMPLSSFLVN